MDFPVISSLSGPVPSMPILTEDLENFERWNNYLRMVLRPRGLLDMCDGKDVYPEGRPEPGPAPKGKKAKAAGVKEGTEDEVTVALTLPLSPNNSSDLSESDLLRQQTAWSARNDYTRQWIISGLAGDMASSALKKPLASVIYREILASVRYLRQLNIERTVLDYFDLRQKEGELVQSFIRRAKEMAASLSELYEEDIPSMELIILIKNRVHPEFGDCLRSMSRARRYTLEDLESTLVVEETAIKERNKQAGGGNLFRISSSPGRPPPSSLKPVSSPSSGSHASIPLPSSIERDADGNIRKFCMVCWAYGHPLSMCNNFKTMSKLDKEAAVKKVAKLGEGVSKLNVLNIVNNITPSSDGESP